VRQITPALCLMHDEAGRRCAAAHDLGLSATPIVLADLHSLGQSSFRLVEHQESTDVLSARKPRLTRRNAAFRTQFQLKFSEARQHAGCHFHH
jgi:hypothetical protein